jgi:two-component system CheB/CheR fusion protein
MPVTVVYETMPILANHVYMIPPDTDLTMDNFSFKLTSPRTGAGKQIDLFFISLANEMSSHAVGIVLSG